jgi:hypothetical protein
MVFFGCDVCRVDVVQLCSFGVFLVLFSWVGSRYYLISGIAICDSSCFPITCYEINLNFWCTHCFYTFAGSRYTVRLRYIDVRLWDVVLSCVCFHTHGNDMILVFSLLVVIETGCGFCVGECWCFCWLVMLRVVEQVWWQGFGLGARQRSYSGR